MSRDELSKKRVTDIVRREGKKSAPDAPAAPLTASVDKKEPARPERNASPEVRDPEMRLAEIKDEVRQMAQEAGRWEEQIDKFETEEVARFGEERETARRRYFTTARVAVVLIIIFAVTGAGYSAFEILPRVRIAITLVKTPWEYNDSVVAAKNAALPNATSTMIPAQVFTARKNFTFSYPATGKKQVSRRAEGTIAIVNAYSSAPQRLVAQTRLADSAGRVFRLTKAVVVPGATINDGRIVPSRLEAEVVADKPGPEHNILPTRLTIPGFAGSLKYDGFYAEMKETFTGGFTGELAYPTENDIGKAKAEARTGIKDTVESFLSLQIPEELRILEGARQFTILRETVQEEVDAKGNFGYFIEAESVAVAFQESDVVSLLLERGRREIGRDDLDIKSYTIEYGAPRLDAGQGKMSFAVRFKGVLTQPMDAENLKRELAGKSEAEVRSYLFALKDRERATVTFWPFWVKSVPDDLRRIAIAVE